MSQRPASTISRRLWIMAVALMALGPGEITAAQPPADGNAVSSAALTNWNTALSVYLTSRNPRLVERALRLLDEPIATLLPREQPQARDYFEQLVRQGFAANSRSVPCLFAPEQHDKREALFRKLEPVSWGQWNGASLNRLLRGFSESPAAYDTAALLHEDFLGFCRAHLSDAPAPLVESLLAKYHDKPFFDVLCFAHHVHPDQASPWRTALESRYGSAASVLSLWQAFDLLDGDIWRGLPQVRQGYQRHLGKQLFARPPLSDWVVLTPPQVLRLAVASSHNLLEWQFKLASALKERRSAEGLALLYHLCRGPGARKETYAQLRPLFAEPNQDFFLYLHASASEGQSVLGLLNEERSNWRSSLQVLSGYLSLDREPQWNAAFFPLLKDYYGTATSDERGPMDRGMIAPIYNVYADQTLAPQRKQNPIRAALLQEAVDSACFLEIPSHQALAEWFRTHVDLGAVVGTGARSIPNYRFVAEASLAVGERRLKGMRDRATAQALAGELALWGNWMLEGMLANPQELTLDSDMVNDTLSLVLGKVRDLKHEFALRPEELGLQTLFARLNQELSNAVAEMSRRDRTGPGSQQAAQRLVRAIHLALVVSAILEDESQLETILTIIQRDLFALKGDAEFRVLDSAGLQFMVGTFLLLDDDLIKCLGEISRSSAAARRPELETVARRFLTAYHRRVQLGLVCTNEFLATLQRMTPGPGPFLRLLDAGPGRGLRPFDDDEAKASFEALKASLAACDFLNGEEAIVRLLTVYRRRLGLSLWKDPRACGVNANVNLMVLMRLLREETPPAFVDLENSGRSASEWPRPALIQVIDALLESLEKGQSDLRLRSVTYAGPGIRPARSAVEHHPAWLFATFTERLLRAQEMASFPLRVAGSPVAAEAHIDALLRSALQEKEIDLPALSVAGREAGATRSLDGSRRLRLVAALGHPADTVSVVRLAQFAVLLPNDPCNAPSPGQLPQYDACRAAVFQQLCDAFSRGENVGSEIVADALIAALRLEFSQRARTPALKGREWIEQCKDRLTPDGRQRVLMEMLMQAETRVALPARVGCKTHESRADVNCVECRASLARALQGRVQELVDVRRFCAEKMSVKFEGPPQSKLDVIGQLSRSVQRLRNASEIIKQINPDSVKAAYRLLRQLKRAYAVIPPHWSGSQIKQHVSSPDDPLAVALVGIERLGAAMYSEFLPFHGDFEVPAILANPDALVVFSLLDAELKGQYLKSMPVTTALEAQMEALQTPIGTPETIELVLVHSIVQPSLAVDVWEQGRQRLADGKSLIEFVVAGKSYDESFYDRDLVYVVSGEFTLNPRKLFEEAFQGIDVAARAAQQRDTKAWDGDTFVYEVWFGDLRAALREQGQTPRECFNLDRFVRRAARIGGDQRYMAPEFAAVRPFAERFQQELKTWLASAGPAVLTRMLEDTSSVRTLLALGEGICDRLGLGGGGALADAVEPEYRGAYADFCAKVLFARGDNGRARYPAAVVTRLCTEFYRADPGAELTLAVCRQRFEGIFQPFSLPHWGATGRSSDEGHRLTGYEGLYRRMSGTASSVEAKRFLGDCTYALMAFASELYWHGGRDGVEGGPIVPDDRRVSYPWRLGVLARPYVIGDVPENALTAERLHTPATQANAEWRAACAQRYRQIPFLCRFFGGSTVPEGKHEGGQP